MARLVHAKKRKLLDEYRFPVYRPKATIKGIFGDPGARIITLERRQKKRFVESVVHPTKLFTTTRYDGYEIYRAGTSESM